MDPDEYFTVFFVFTAILALITASPALSRLLIFPRTDFFTEYWILGPDHKAESYPFNISRGQNYSVFIGIRNQLGRCGYYGIKFKFHNQTQLYEGSLDYSPSFLNSIYNMTAFVEDEGVWEMPLTFSFNYSDNQSFQHVIMYDLTVNGLIINMDSYNVGWNSEKNGFLGVLYFELWLYDLDTRRFHFHERFLLLQLNMTV